MIRLYLAGAALIAFLAVGTGFAAQSQKVKSLRKDLAAANQRVIAAEYAAEKSAEVETITRTVYVRAEKASVEIQKTDPQCANAEPTLAAWRAGLASLHEGSSSVGYSTSQP